MYRYLKVLPITSSNFVGVGNKGRVETEDKMRTYSLQGCQRYSLAWLVVKLLDFAAPFIS